MATISQRTSCVTVPAPLEAAAPRSLVPLCKADSRRGRVLGARFRAQEPLRKEGRCAWAAATGSCLLVVAARGCQRRYASERGGLLSRRVQVTGPGWTDEVARIVDPRPDGPKWDKKVGYRGRKALRLMLDGEDIVHSYAQAKYYLTGKWTGPLSAGIEKAIQYGAWDGSITEEPEEGAPPPPVQLYSPEILTFVAMPADMIEATAPGHLVDGYPQALREELGRVQEIRKGVWLNQWICSLQDISRLYTWRRPADIAPDTPRPNALLVQKYFETNRMVTFESTKRPPMVLAHCLGAGQRLQVGQEVEALKRGQMIKGAWQPSKWEKGRVLAANYDGTYDIKFERQFGPWRWNKKYNVNGKRVPLSLKRNEIYFDNWGADHMPASFRLSQEWEHAEGLGPDQIRLIGSYDRLSEVGIDEGSQDWFVISNKDFVMTTQLREQHERFSTFKNKFQIGYRWVPNETGDDVLFEPMPNAAMAESLRVNHKDVVGEFRRRAASFPERQAVPELMEESDPYAEKLASLKEAMSEALSQTELVPTVRYDAPTRPAGPLMAPKKKQPVEPWER